MAKVKTSFAVSASLLRRLDVVAGAVSRSRSSLAEELMDRGLRELEGGVFVEAARVAEVAAPSLGRAFVCEHRLPPTAFCVHCDREG